MQTRFVHYTNKVVRLPKGLAFLVILLLLVLIPLLVALFVVAGVATLLVKSVTSFLPSRKKEIQYDEYEVIEPEENKKLPS